MKNYILIKKDWNIGYGWLLLGLVLVIVAPIYFICISELESWYIECCLYLSALFATNIFISRVCYLEDNYETQKFLYSLPVFHHQFIQTRYIESLLLLIFFFVIAIINGLAFGMNLHFEIIAMMFIFGLTLESIYLALFYKWGSNISQYSYIVIIFISIIIYYILDKFNINICIMGTSNTVKASVVAIYIGLYLFIVYIFGKYQKSKMQKN